MSVTAAARRDPTSKQADRGGHREQRRDLSHDGLLSVRGGNPPVDRVGRSGAELSNNVQATERVAVVPAPGGVTTARPRNDPASIAA